MRQTLSSMHFEKCCTIKLKNVCLWSKLQVLVKIYLPAEFRYIPLAEQVFPIHSPCTGNCGIGNVRASKSCEMLKLYANERQITLNNSQYLWKAKVVTLLSTMREFFYIYFHISILGWLVGVLTQFQLPWIFSWWVTSLKTYKSYTLKWIQVWL